MISGYGLSERDKSQEGHLEMLESERDADNGQAAEDSERKMEQGNLNASHKNPDHIHQDRKTAAVVRS